MKPASIASRKGEQRMLSSYAVRSFRNELQGEVLRPEGEGYEAAGHPWNGMSHPSAPQRPLRSTVLVAALSGATARGFVLIDRLPTDPHHRR